MTLTQCFDHALKHMPEGLIRSAIARCDVGDGIIRENRLAKSIGAGYVFLDIIPPLYEVPACLILAQMERERGIQPILVRATNSNSVCFGEAWCLNNRIHVKAMTQPISNGAQLIPRGMRMEIIEIIVQVGEDTTGPVRAVSLQFPDTVKEIE